MKVSFCTLGCKVNQYDTDAMRELARKEGMMGIEYSGKRYDMGNKLSIMQANVEQALAHKEIGRDFKEYIKQLAKTL